MPTDVSHKTRLFTESVIREMTRRALRNGAVNLAQGFPDFPAPTEIKEAAKRAIDEDYNQYAITHGSPNFRAAIAAKVRSYNKIECDADKNVTVTCGATEAMIATLLAVINPGDEVIIFEPFYENYGPDVTLSGATARFITLRDPDFSIDRKELEAAFTRRTKAIIINTPHNPTGKVYSRAELEMIAELCQRHDTLAITDEIYEHIIYGGAQHLSIASLPGMADRTVTISGLSKTFSITGWRLAYTIASERLTSAIRKVHDFLTVGAPHPLQEAGATALKLPAKFYADLAAMYERKRATLLNALNGAGLKCRSPQGAYYIIADIGHLGFGDDFAAADFLLDQVGVAAVPGSSFYRRPELGKRKIRFTFSKSDETLAKAAERLGDLNQRLRARRPIVAQN
ncbi:MAG TPA: aminotransferase class I/II-fold pyridoxal phosphate-dependent enzyme [Candidatus Binataceae bacterium]|nr:aminotransferase class I/II-fold pyridoxal phosphate-dependent enzyme [Candidatus Binataceae bacterium]